MEVNIIRNKFRQRQLTIFPCATVNIQFEYFLNEETDGVLTDAMANFQGWHLIRHLNPNLTLRSDSPFKRVRLLCQGGERAVSGSVAVSAVRVARPTVSGSATLTVTDRQSPCNPLRLSALAATGARSVAV